MFIWVTYRKIMRLLPATRCLITITSDPSFRKKYSHLLASGAAEPNAAELDRLRHAPASNQVKCTKSILFYLVNIPTQAKNKRVLLC